MESGERVMNTGSVEAEMQKYLEQELRRESKNGSIQQPLDLSLPKKIDPLIPRICLTNDLVSVQTISDPYTLSSSVAIVSTSLDLNSCSDSHADATISHADTSDIHAETATTDSYTVVQDSNSADGEVYRKCSQSSLSESSYLGMEGNLLLNKLQDKEGNQGAPIHSGVEGQEENQGTPVLYGVGGEEENHGVPLHSRFRGQEENYYVKIIHTDIGESAPQDIAEREEQNGAQGAEPNRGERAEHKRAERAEQRTGIPVSRLPNRKISQTSQPMSHASQPLSHDHQPVSHAFNPVSYASQNASHVSQPVSHGSHTSSYCLQPLSLSEDLKKLESKLERYMPKAGSEAGSETSEVSDGSARSSSSLNSLVNRLHHGQTATTRAKAAENVIKNGDPMTASVRGKLTDSFKAKVDMNQKLSGGGGGGSPPDKSSGTASMLKSTLRKMSRFTMPGGKGKKDEEAKEKVSPEPISRSRPLISTKPSLLSPPGVGRSKSFKEPEKPGTRRQDSVTRNQPYTSSLRRTKQKIQQEQESSSQGSLQRTGTGGGLERSGMRRSVSANRGGARVVKKSRTVQTQLTLDAGLEGDDAEPCGTIQFQVWLPDLLGEPTDLVETHVDTTNEPVDVRKNRQLTLENMKLQREVERLKAQTTENDLLKKELKNVKVKLEEEQRTRLSIQKDLENNHERVRAIMLGMESVERELESRGDMIQQLQVKLSRTQVEEEELMNQLAAAGQTINTQNRELERSMAAQKTLIHQLQESEAEAKELQDFLQAEKSTLVDALRDAEGEVRRLKTVISDKDDSLSRLEEQSSLLVRRAEQRSQELLAARAELSGIKERAREMLLAQGAELSRASIAVSQIYDRLEQLVPDLQLDGDESESSDSRSEQLELGVARRSSQFLVTPTENLDVLSEFSRALMSASTGSDNLGEAGNSISNLASAIAERKLTEASSQNGSLSVPSLADQINQLSLVLSRILTNQAITALPPPTNHPTNGSSRFNVNEDLDIENIDLGNVEVTRSLIFEQNRVLSQLRLAVQERENSLAELRAKFSKNRQILTSNWQQAEEEVRKLDEIYHETVHRVLQALQAFPEVVGENPNLAHLVLSLQEEMGDLSAADGVNGNHSNVANVKSKSESLLSRSFIKESISNSGSLALVSMSQSLLIEATMPVGLKAGVFSEPCLAKSPLGSIPSLLTSPGSRFQEEDLNANQSL